MSTTLDAESLPSLQQAVLDAATLARLVSDIEGLTLVDEVLLKGGGASMASTQRSTLAEAVDALQRGQVVGVQVRYRYQGQAWWDTLLRAPQGIRLVRIAHDLEAAGSR
ncbi:hypothetical protein HPC49_05960 [Pyxidicoccus fallax]|uniref:Uncharacterized protein n=1 Tax=Pyxidicoccus fallax TaxID=394095 RepID=A0A848L9H1_9BACT|nr:hypothetical protein [Pyxidicoccus fallax]NMO14902.1 hypothetical protein [Pyxidicoccus fallax]NPC77797.1 hypothetical protein [Pyxidicoccus fallax]